MTKKATRPSVDSPDSISLNKYISDTGFCSRREADNYIGNGRVTINDQVAIPGNRVGAGDRVEIDGEPLKKRNKTLYIAFHKPVGVTSTTDRQDRNNIVDYIGHPERIFPIGRLDKDSEGLIFLTNDGNIVNKILRAGNNHEKEYIVTVDKPIDRNFVMRMSDGVEILGEVTKPCKVVQEAKAVFRITLTQGLNRQIRRMCEALGYTVKKLRRIRIMNIHIGDLGNGQWRYLTIDEIANIQKLVSSSSKTEEASIPKEPRTRRGEEKKPAPVKPGKNVQPAAKKKDFKEKATAPARKDKKPSKSAPAKGKRGASAAATTTGSYKTFRDKAKKKG